MSPEVQRLLENVIDSFEKLEMIRCLWKRGATTATTDQLAERVGTGSDHILPALAALMRAGLVVAVSPDVYAAARGNKQGGRVEELLALYDDDPIAVMRVINEIAVQRIRGMAARTFADSFVLRKSRKGEPDDG
jgi:hypothetical protein